MPHPTGNPKARDPRRQDQFAVAALHQAATVVAPALLRRTLALLMAMVITGALSQATVPVSSFAASHVNVFSADIPKATEDVLTTGAYDYRPAGSVRSVAQLTVPAGAHWKTDGSDGSVMLTMAAGALQVAISDGTARIVHPSGADTLHELAPGASVMLFARDRLVMRGSGSLLTGNVGQDPVVAAVVRVS
jgi:hypothetical protein